MSFSSSATAMLTSGLVENEWSRVNWIENVEPNGASTIQANGGNLPEFDVDDALLHESDRDEDDIPPEKKLKRYVTSSPGSLGKIAIVVGVRSQGLIIVVVSRRDMEMEYTRWEQAKWGLYKFRSDQGERQGSN